MRTSFPFMSALVLAACNQAPTPSAPSADRWLADIDAALVDRGIETSSGDFRAERGGTVDYRRLADNGAEVISVDDVRTASRVLQAAERSRDLLKTCPAAR